ncbi:unnamed protein product [Polarella glacialis]|uniref:Uncharacterized protein n=1 Tax=Polarella glacialis TaxID=89957 RepID=A0A813LP83_POLGL|nr:unnamed protein product [Polarella glacialis]|mmetsp:Transcript_64641/g.104536  ORF Transcript_64641/g.104536 Transcript_64641/m.104536 type:complete len:305 (-) Transcript_64641:89-1003(-)
MSPVQSNVVLRHRMLCSSTLVVIALLVASFGSAAVFVPPTALPRQWWAPAGTDYAGVALLADQRQAKATSGLSVSLAATAAASVALAAATFLRSRRSLQGDCLGKPRLTALRAWPWEDDDPYSKCTALKLQLGLQFSKKMIDTLNKLADSADTDSDEGLHKLLLDVMLALRRTEPTWRYGSCERLVFDAEDEGRAAGAALQRWGLEGQSKWGDGEDWETMDKTPEGMTEFIVVTLTLSCYGLICPEDEKLKVRKLTDVKKILDQVSGIQVDELMQLDVQWIPEEEGDSLSAMEVTMKFPELVML